MFDILHWLTTWIDLYRRQVQTWENLPGDLQNKIVKRIVKTIEDRMTQQHGFQQESTVGFKHDIDALRRELASE